jgi:hypothetical protein
LSMSHLYRRRSFQQGDKPGVDRWLLASYLSG